jgi:hypothetical protein
MASEMVMRVAKALARDFDLQRPGGSEPRSWEELSETAQDSWILSAVAAIRAMEEPTQGMLDYRPGGQLNSDALTIWKLQIHEAIHGKPQPHLTSSTNNGI